MSLWSERRVDGTYTYVLEISRTRCEEYLFHDTPNETFCLWTASFSVLDLAHNGSLSTALKNCTRYADVSAFSLFEDAKKLPLGQELGHYGTKRCNKEGDPIN